MICYFCKKDGADTTVDYCTATGRKTLPGLNSRNFDARYGYPAHTGCLDKKMQRLEKSKRTKQQ